MATRYAHDETYVLRNGTQKKRTTAADAPTKRWKKMVAVAGAAMSAGAVSAAYLKLNSQSEVMNLEAKHSQLRGSETAAQLAMQEPRLTWEMANPQGNRGAMQSTLDDLMRARWMEKENRIAADASLTPEQVHAQQQEVRGVWFKLMNCVRVAFDEAVRGHDTRWVLRDNFDSFSDVLYARCPNLVPYIEGEDESTPASTPAPTEAAPLAVDEAISSSTASPVASVSLQLDALDTDKNGDLSFSEVEAFLQAESLAKEEAIEKDATVDSAIRSTKISLAREVARLKLECWSAVFSEATAHMAVPVIHRDQFVDFAAALSTTCPNEAITSVDEPLPEQTKDALSLVPDTTTDSTAVEKSTEEVHTHAPVETDAQEQEKENQLEKEPSVFTQLDTNDDQVVDATELQRYWTSYFAQLAGAVLEDASLSEEEKAVKVQSIEKASEQRMRCIHLTLHQLEADHIKITPERLPLLESLLGPGCEHVADKDDDDNVSVTGHGDAEPTTEPVDTATSEPNLLEIVESTSPGEPPVETEAPTPDEIESSPVFKQIDLNHDRQLDRYELEHFLTTNFDNLIQHAQEDASKTAEERSYLVHELQSERTTQVTCTVLAFDKMMTEKMMVTPETYDMLERLATEECPLHKKEQSPGPATEPKPVESTQPPEEIATDGRYEPATTGESPAATEEATTLDTTAPVVEETPTVTPTSDVVPSISDHPWKIASDPQPGPPPGSDAIVNDSHELKDMLLKAFGLNKQGGLATEEQPAPATDEVPPVNANEPTDEATAKEEMKEALLKVLAPQLVPEATPADRPIITIAPDHGSWNWLHPSVETYGQVKDADADSVSLPAVYHHLVEERASRTQALLSAMLRTELDYTHTITCLTKGADMLKKHTISHDEYTSLVQWMNDKCVNPDEVKQEKEKDKKDHKYMTKAEFKALIARHFQPVIDDLEAGRVSIDKAMTHAKNLQASIASCIDIATERAVDSSGGQLHDALLAPSLDWIVDTCVDQQH